jgi:hypothetical protein
VLLPLGDGRSRQARRYRDVAVSFEAELGGDLTEADRSLVALATGLTLAVEGNFADRMAGIKIDEDQATRAAGTLRRVVANIRARAAEIKAAVDPMQAYLARRAEAEAADEGADQ